MKRAYRVILVVVIIILALQFFRPSLNNPPVTGDLKAPAEVKAVLERACYDCHSNQTRLRWFDQVVPAFWNIAQDVKDGRKALNFSNWDSLPKLFQMLNLFEAVFMIEQKAMPLSAYTYFHHGGIVTTDEIAVLKQYVAPLGLGYKLILDTAKEHEAARQYGIWKQTAGRPTAKDEPNGIAYAVLAAYPEWQVVSTNDRFDLGEFHVILGNSIAVKAIREGHTNPYPDGAIFAKPAWQQVLDSSGEVLSGSFVRAEFMIRDSKKYASTFGWGWCRWVGGDLTPYGKDASFVNECMNCHRPLEKSNYVFTSPYVDSMRVGEVAASTLDGIAFPLRGKLVATYSNHTKGTMSTLYSSAPVTKAGAYTAGTVVSLVTWTWQDDANWFGGRTPQTMQSVEQIQFGADGKPEYNVYAGPGLTKKEIAAGQVAHRVQYITAKRASVTP